MQVEREARFVAISTYDKGACGMIVLARFGMDMRHVVIITLPRRGKQRKKIVTVSIFQETVVFVDI